MTPHFVEMRILSLLSESVKTLRKRHDGAKHNVGAKRIKFEEVSLISTLSMQSAMSMDADLFNSFSGQWSYSPQLLLGYQADDACWYR